MRTSQASAPLRYSSPYDLDSLARLSLDDLDDLYRHATAPSSIRAVDGALRGRMLAVRGLPSALTAPLRGWAAAPSFVWEGKTFLASSDTAGAGHNRIRIAGVLGRQNLFPFETCFDTSAIDGRPTLVLDYDLEANPPYIRRIHDELRQIEPGLFAGPAMWKRETDKVLVLWFALDARRT